MSTTLRGLGYVFCVGTRQTAYQVVKGLWRCESGFDGTRIFAVAEATDTSYNDKSAFYSRPSRDFEFGAKSPSSKSISGFQTGRDGDATAPSPTNPGVESICSSGFRPWATNVITTCPSRPTQSHPTSAYSYQWIDHRNKYCSASTEHRRRI
jgi:hypothetical protein